MRSEMSWRRLRAIPPPRWIDGAGAESSRGPWRMSHVTTCVSTKTEGDAPDSKAFAFSRRQVVACPRPFEPAEQVALALAECGCLAQYVTGFVWRGDPNALEVLARLVGSRASAALNRRVLPLLP